jgi:alkylation response protein AidB-like acyl-CoA dehydrogenase
MILELTDDQRAFQQSMARFAESASRPHAAAIDERARSRATSWARRPH